MDYFVIYTSNDDIVERYNRDLPEDEKVTSLYGYTDYKQRCIYIDKNMDKVSRQRTLIHERMHEFLYEKRLKLENEEDFCFIMEVYYNEIMDVIQEVFK